MKKTSVKVRNDIVCTGIQKKKRKNLVKKINSDGTFKKVLTLRCTTKVCQTYRPNVTNTFLLVRISMATVVVI